MNAKTLAILVASISALSLTACGKNKDESTRLSDATPQQQQSQSVARDQDKDKADSQAMPPAANPNPASPAQETPSSNPQEAPKTTQ